jgi:hypothetical protein
MPGLTGLDTAAPCPRTARTSCATAHPEHAVRAFDPGHRLPARRSKPRASCAPSISARPPRAPRPACRDTRLAVASARRHRARRAVGDSHAVVGWLVVTIHTPAAPCCRHEPAGARGHYRATRSGASIAARSSTSITRRRPRGRRGALHRASPVVPRSRSAPGRPPTAAAPRARRRAPGVRRRSRVRRCAITRGAWRRARSTASLVRFLLCFAASLCP